MLYIIDYDNLCIYITDNNGENITLDFNQDILSNTNIEQLHVKWNTMLKKYSIDITCKDVVDFIDFIIVKIQQRTECYGCITQQANQMAHMFYGGCLYNPSNDI